MAFLTTLLSYLLVTLSTSTILYIEGQFQNSATPDAGVITEPEDVSTVTPSVDVITEPQSTTSAPATATRVITDPSFFSATPPLKLICPGVMNPDKFLSTSWYMVISEKMFGLYRIDKQGLVSTYKAWYNISGINVRHNVTSTKALMVYDDTCNHTATYRCMRSARLGYSDEVYSFSVANCTLLQKIVPRGSVTLGNASPRLLSSILILAISIVQFISSY